MRLRSFSYGPKFESKHKRSLSAPLDVGTAWSWVIKPSFKEADLCFLMCPPRACPIPNSSPQMGHWCFFCAIEHERFEAMSFSFLWLARWPPSAWNEWNFLLRVLHLKSPQLRTLSLDGVSVSPTLVSNIKQLAMPTSLSLSLPLFMSFRAVSIAKKE